MWTWLSKIFTVPAAPAICDSDIRYHPHLKNHLMFRTTFIGWRDNMGDLHFYAGIPFRVRACAIAFAAPRRQHIRDTLRAPLDPKGFFLKSYQPHDVLYQGITIGGLCGTRLSFEQGVPWRIRKGAKAFLAPEITRRKAGAT